MEFKFSKHALEEATRRDISLDSIEAVLRNPQQIVTEYGGKNAYQAKIESASGKMKLLRVIVDDVKRPPVVITVYRTSRINKYWRLP
ncbi:MAG: DUF4258 domain-containing protein [Nitrospinae bacterium]|nr:DUF4258 domain-containing protein [Nitrospinota bacterium]